MSRPVFNGERLEELRQLSPHDTSFLANVIDVYLSQLDSLPGQIRQAVADREEITAAQLAHSLKGSSSNLGAEALADLCRRFEDRARGGASSAELTGLVRVLDEMVGTTRETFTRERARLA